MPSTAARAWPRTAFRAGIPLLLIAILAGCGMIPPEPKTEAAQDVFWLYNVVLAMGAVVFIGVEGFIVYSVIRYRRRDDRLPAQTHGNTLVEIIWTAIPTVIVLIIFGLSVVTLRSVEAKSDPAQGGVDIEVDGFQWQWEFRYLDDDNNPDNDYSVVGGDPAKPPVMVVPVNEPIRLRLVSSDVIHSFYVPQFLIKRDLIPFPEGEPPNTLEFTVTDVGVYGGQCAEFCGDGHSRMTFSVQAVSRDDYNKWLEDARAGRSPKPSAQPGGEVLALTASNFAFDKTELHAAADKPFTLRLVNKDPSRHNVVIVDADNKEIARTDDLTGPDATGEVNVPGLPAGEYTFYCTFHASTMVGKLIVE
jgi:cytochrome c oxidase subunit 2